MSRRRPRAAGINILWQYVLTTTSNYQIS